MDDLVLDGKGFQGYVKITYIFELFVSKYTVKVLVTHLRRNVS